MIPGRTVAFILGVLPWLVSCQMATCSNDLPVSVTWTFNQEGQSPCQVATALGAVCAGPAFSLQALPATFIYLGPQLGFANPCRCSSVYYSMMAACSYCQGRDYLRWSAYNTNCTTVYDQVYPSPIPTRTGVPSYAYLQVTLGDTFNTTAAQAVDASAHPDSTALPSPTATATTSGFTTNAPFQQHAAKKTNVGAIVGGVIGGLVVLGLIIGIVIWVLVKKKRAQQSYPPSGPSRENQALNQPSYTSPALSQSQSPMTQAYTGGSTTPFVPSQPTKLYDPNDPTTFPIVQDGAYSPPFNPQTPNRAFSPAASHTQSSSPDPHMRQALMHAQPPLSPSFTGTSSSLQTRTNYTGAPELG